MKRIDHPPSTSFRLTRADATIRRTIYDTGIRETARRAGVSASLVSGWLSGSKAVSESTARKICEAVGVAWPMV